MAQSLRSVDRLPATPRLYINASGPIEVASSDSLGDILALAADDSGGLYAATEGGLYTIRSDGTADYLSGLPAEVRGLAIDSPSQ